MDSVNKLLLLFYSENQWVRVSVPDNKTTMQQQTHNMISQLKSL